MVRMVAQGPVIVYCGDMPTDTRTSVIQPEECIVETTRSPWVSRAEAAAYLGVGTPALDRYVREGKLARYKVAGTQTVRFRRSDVEAMITPDESESDTQ